MKTKIGYLSSYSTPLLDRRYIFWASCSANSRERIEIILRKTAYCFRPDLVKSQAYFNIVPTGNVIIICAIRKARMLVGITRRAHNQFAYAEHLLTRHITSYMHADALATKRQHKCIYSHDGIDKWGANPAYNNHCNPQDLSTQSWVQIWTESSQQAPWSIYVCFSDNLNEMHILIGFLSINIGGCGLKDKKINLWRTNKEIWQIIARNSVLWYLLQTCIL